MKKLLLFCTALLSASALTAQTNCADLFISEYVEGWVNNKALELYNPTNASITLDNSYRLIRWANGSTTSDQDPLYVLPLTGTIGSFTTWVIIQDTIPAGQDTMVWPALRAKADWLAPYDWGGTTPGGNVVFWNGDDAISLQKKQTNGTWLDIDIFGEIGVRPFNWMGGTSPSGAWTDTAPYWQGTGAYLTKSKTLIRKHTVKHGIDRATMYHYGDSTTNGIPNSFYAFVEYDSMPVNFFDSLGGHWCNCDPSVGSKEIGVVDYFRIINLYPNPANEKINVEFYQYSPSVRVFLELFSTDGQLLTHQQINGMMTQIDISQLSKGMYFISIVDHDGFEVFRSKILKY